MAIQKKRNNNQRVQPSSSYTRDTSALLHCLVQKLFTECQRAKIDIEDLVDNSTLFQLFSQFGMPKHMLKTSQWPSKKQLNWLEEKAFNTCLSEIKQSTFFSNLRNLASYTTNPRFYFRLYLFCYLKQTNYAFNALVENFISEYGSTGVEQLAINTVLGLYEQDFIQELVERSNLSQQNLLVNNDKNIPSFLASNPKCIHADTINDINSAVFLNQIELPSKFVKSIRLVDIKSPEQLVRIAYQLENEAKLQAKDFDKDTFEPLFNYLHHTISTKQKGVNILLHGEPGVGKTELVKTLAEDLDCDLFDISLNDDEDRYRNLSDGMFAELCKTHSLCNSLDDIILLVDECDDFFHESVERGRNIRKQSVNYLLENNHLPTIWVTNRPYMLEGAYLRRFDMVFEVSLPIAEDYNDKVRTISRGLRLSSSFITHICQHQQLSIGHVEKAIQVTKALNLTAKSAEQQMIQLLNGYLIASGHEQLNYTNKTKSTTYDLSLTNSKGDCLKAVKKGIQRIGSARTLLFGPPGTGKSAYARHLSDELGLPLIVKKASDLLGAYVGETEKAIASAFDEAKKEGAILLLDEVDSFLNSREGHSRSWESTMVNEMLTQMETFDGVFIATTNFNQKLDHAVSRRFDFKIKLDYLNAEQSISLFRRLTKQNKLSKTIKNKVSKLANLTPGDFSVVSRKAALLGKHDENELWEILLKESDYKTPSKANIGFVCN